MTPGSRTQAVLASAPLPLIVAAAPAATAGAEPPASDTATVINKQATNPVSLTWSLKWENEILSLQRDDAANRGQYEMKLQPTMPLLLTPAWKLIVRPELVLLNDKPFTRDGRSRRVTGTGDTTLDVVVAPVSDPWLLAVGPTFIFPTASNDETGQGNWQAGPGRVAGYLGKKWLLGLIAQQWWSFAGPASRKADSGLHLQYLTSWFLPHGWSIGTSPIIKFDWRAAAGQQVTFPLGLFVARVVELGGLPVKLEVQGLYAPVRPESYGEQFGIPLYVTPVIPAPVEGPLFGG